ncbi:bifunctional phosphopantothenoylcysteine decarboxylase/phosphopantothenate--cysteine ligase CoaBC, partial [bacterium]|nr:bifunctional phosphopantothenoylcysteine decarboxylase/phosphopantothenate--cysteine ligase CoaBC [bacterium]
MTARSGKRLVIGVTGGIAAYKAAELTREFQKRQFDVRVVMTRNACQFIGKTTFESLTGYPVIIDMFVPGYSTDGIRHTNLADWADFVVVAPATANIIGKFTHGIADDFLSTFLMAFDKPVLFAPAMNPRMFNSHILQENITAMKSRGVSFAGPETGKVACGDHGTGKMSDPVTIADLACAMAGQNGDLKGKRVLISAGPTCEKIDPVRFITNRSSGKMGYAIADAAVERGAVVTLVSGPVSIKPHKVVTTIPVVNADDMLEQVLVCYPENDILIMAAAVADWKMVSTC